MPHPGSPWLWGEPVPGTFGRLFIYLLNEYREQYKLYFIVTFNFSIYSIQEINPEYSSEGLRLKLKLKLQYSDHLTWRADSSEKTLMLGKNEGRRRRARQRMRWLDGITKSMEMSEQAPGNSDGQGTGVLQSTGSQRAGHYWETEQQKQIYIDIYVLSFLNLPHTPTPTSLGCHRALDWAPCVV